MPYIIYLVQSYNKEQESYGPIDKGRWYFAYKFC